MTINNNNPQDTQAPSNLDLPLSEIGHTQFDNCLLVNFHEKINKLEELIVFIDDLFHNHSHIHYLQFEPSKWELNIAFQALSQHINMASFSRYEFYNSSVCWLPRHDERHIQEVANTVVPLGQNILTGEVYRKIDQNINQVISFKVIDPESDLTLFHQWMNEPRVAEFWDQAWSKEELHNYIEKKLASPSELPLIGYFNDVPFGYFEVYWVAHDRIAPYYPWQAFDRGLHLLVGNAVFRGSSYFKAWCRAISHFIFLDDARTEKIVLEPRSDNHRLFNQIEKLDFKKEFEFNFPHKRATLVSVTKNAFFKKNFNCRAI
jgi:acetyl CoA:N6-hydroxylysine acetyl transferase